MPDRDYIYNELKKTIIAKYGKCSEEFKFYGDDGLTKGVFIFEDAQIIVFFEGKKDYCPINFSWLISCKVEEIVNYIEKTSTKSETPYLRNAIIGTILGGFFHSSRKTITTERIPVSSYWLRIALTGESPLSEYYFDFSKESQIPYKVEAIIKDIVDRSRAASDLTPNDKLVKVRYEDFPKELWLYVPDKIQRKVYSNIDGSYIPQSVINKAKVALADAKEWERKLGETVSLNNEGSALEKAGEIDKAIEVYEKCISIGYQATHSYDRLLVLYHKLKRVDDEIRICQLAIKMFPENEKYPQRMCKLDGSAAEKKTVLPTLALVFNASVLWGEKYFEELKKLKEFDFYHKGYDNNEYYRNYLASNKYKAINNVIEHFDAMIKTADNAEKSGNLATAAAIYEQIIAEKYYGQNPYDRLIKIYAKSKLKDDEKRILVYAIETLSKYRSQQADYIRGQARKYGAVDFCEKYISGNKSISYFIAGGGYRIYDPYNIIEKWKERLGKMA